jgi:hypothetical protein
LRPLALSRQISTPPYFGIPAFELFLVVPWSFPFSFLLSPFPLFSRPAPFQLSAFGISAFGFVRPWLELAQGKAITELWLARQLRPYGIRPRMMRTADRQARGYSRDDCMEAFRRYIPKSEKDALLSSLTGEVTHPPKMPKTSQP